MYQRRLAVIADRTKRWLSSSRRSGRRKSRRVTYSQDRIRAISTFVREKLLKECHRPSFADVARYRKPIGKGVEGLSIRFAEAALRLMKNITIQQTVVSEDEFTRKSRRSRGR